MTQKLDADSTGKWRIVTQGSEHLWDLDERTWVRTQRSGLNRMSYDGKVRELHQIVVWPEVDGHFLVWCREHRHAVSPTWHRSSTIKSIEKVDK